MAKVNKGKDNLILEIPRNLLLKKTSHAKKFILVDVEEYKRLLRLVGELEDVQQKIIRGEREYQEGKTIVVDSPRQLLNG